MVENTSKTKGEPIQMKIVYIVTEGEYDDYSICGVCSSEEKAEEYIKKLVRNAKINNISCLPYEIEEWECD